MKMKCIDIFKHAKADLCFDEVGGVSEISGIDKRTVSTVNGLYKFIFFKSGGTGFKPLHNVYDEIDLPEEVIFNCLIPGVAAKIAYDYGDGKQQAFFADLYNQGLRLLNKNSNQITDVLPSVN